MSHKKSKGQTPRQQNQHPVAQPNNADQKHHHTQLAPPISADIHPAPHLAQESNTRGNHPRLGWWRVFEGLGIAAGIAYAVITYCQWQDIRKNFQTDQRAWIGPVPHSDARFELLDADANVITKSMAALKDNLVVRARIFVRNSGKTPAMNVRYKSAVVFANEKPPVTSPLQTWTAIFPDTENDFVSVKSPPLGISATRAKGGDAPGLFIGATICYEDVFGKPHFTKICRVIGPNQPDKFADCELDTIDTDKTPLEEILKECPR